MQTDELWLSFCIEMAAHGIANACMQLSHRGRLGKDRFADSVRGQSPFRRFFNHENDLVHGAIVASGGLANLIPEPREMDDHRPGARVVAAHGNFIG